MRTKVGVMVATPVRHWKGVDALPQHFRTQLEALAALSADPEIPFTFQLAVIEGGLCRARNKIVRSFLNSECKWLLFWDDDIEATAADAIKLLGMKMPVLGGLYCTREKRPHWVANFMHNVTPQKGSLLQVIECGTGFKLYHRKVFEEVARIMGDQIDYTDRDSGERISGFFQQVVIKTDLQPDGDLISEDYFMDYLCRNCGVGVFVDTDLKLVHRGGDGVGYPVDGFPPIPGSDQ